MLIFLQIPQVVFQLGNREHWTGLGESIAGTAFAAEDLHHLAVESSLDSDKDLASQFFTETVLRTVQVDQHGAIKGGFLQDANLYFRMNPQ